MYNPRSVSAGALAPTDYQSEDLGSAWLELARSEAGRKEAEELSVGWIKDRVREASFLPRILPEQKLSPNDPNLQRSVNHDGFGVMVEVEPESVAAMTISMRATPDALLASGRRFLVSFWTIATAKIEFSLASLPAYRMPLTRIFEDNAIKSLHDVRDRTFITHADSAIDFMQETGNEAAVAFNASNVNSGTAASYSKIKGTAVLTAGVDTFAIQRLTAEDLVNAKVRFKQHQTSASGTRVRVGGLEVSVGLVNAVDWEYLGLTTVETVGYALQEKNYLRGMEGDTVKGVTFVKTIKEDVVRRGNVYFFTTPEYMGKSYIWRDLQFWIERSAHMVSWFAWMDVGMCLSNVASIVKLELYGGSTTLDEEDTGYAAAVPLPENQVGTGRNNKVAEGGLSSYVVL